MAWLAPAAPATPLAPSASTLAQSPHEVIFTNLPGLPTSVLQGSTIAFVTGDNGNAFTQVHGSPNGNWIMSVKTQLPGTSNEILIVNGVARLIEGSITAFGGAGAVVGEFLPVKDINDAGEFTFGFKIANTPEDDEFIVKNIGGVFMPVARPGQALVAPPGASVGNRLIGANITADGTTAYYTEAATGVSSGEGNLVLLGDQLLLQSGVSVPPGQSASPGEAFDNLKPSGLWVSEDGAHSFLRADVRGSEGFDDVLIFDGEVVVQERTVIPGFQFQIFTNGIRGAFMDPVGNWYGRGSNGGLGNDWVLRNGDVIARTGAPITPAASEVWDDEDFVFGFFLLAGNAQGDYIVGGVTDGPTSSNAVLVKNGERVVMREGDQVDLDGNGVLDDNATIVRFAKSVAHLTDSGDLFVEVALRIGSAGEIFRSFIRVDTNAPEIGNAYCGAANNSTGAPSALAAFGFEDVAVNDVTLVATNLPPDVFGFFVTSLDQGFVANPAGSGGNLCLSGEIGRFIAPGQILNSGPDGSFELGINLMGLPQPTSTVAVLPLDSWNFQAWHRDALLGSATSNFTNGVSIDFE